MSKEREILQRFHSGMSQRSIALGLHVSRNTVAKVIAAYKASNISQEMLDAIDDDELHRKLCPDEVPNSSGQMPDYSYVHKELLKAGVTLRLLWDEYTANCRSAGRLCIQYSQFCKLYRDYADRHRLTMHINRKHEDPVANRAYQEFADHYHTAILPARVLSPKDKAAVEGNVGNVTSHIIATLRNVKFFSIAEMNAAIAELLEKFNAAPFQKRDGSRLSVFLEEEAPFLQPLPVLPYEYACWKQATVQLNYHVSIDSQNYSCPYAYVRKRVDVRATRSLVEIFCQGKRIASHPRLYGRKGQYATVTEHMPPNHQLYSEWDGNRFRRWARKIGESAFAVVDKLLLSYRVEEQAYKGCLSLLKLGEKYGAVRLELACREALRQVPLPKYSIVSRILATGQDQKVPHVETPKASSRNAFVRGSSYYGGDRHEG